MICLKKPLRYTPAQDKQEDIYEKCIGRKHPGSSVFRKKII
jgi:hypothetical protein